MQTTPLCLSKATLGLRHPVKPLAYAIAFVGVLGLTGCGSSGDQDNGSTQGESTSVQDTISGVALDGYVARATVFVDNNNNGTRETFEVSAFTDDQGYFSYNPLTGSDYCAADASSDEALYCLRYQGSESDVVLRIDGGYDIMTGEPFYGQMSRRIDPSNAGDRVGTVISPLTTVVTSLEDSADQANVMAALGITQDDLDIDYLNASGSADVDSNLFNTALKVHKAVSLMGDLLDDGYTELADENGLPNNAAQSIYAALATSLAAPDTNFDTLARDPNKLAAIMDSAEDSLREAIIQRGLADDLIDDLGSAADSNYFSIVANIAQHIPDLIDQLIGPMDNGVNAPDVIGAARAVEVVVLKALENTGENEQAQAAVDFILNADNSSLISALTDALASDKADLNGLVNTDFGSDAFQSEDGVTTSAQLPDDAEPFADLGGMMLKISDQDLGVAPSDLRDVEVELYFDGEANALKGSFSACVKYIDGANATTGELGEGNTRGELVDGNWSLIGATASKPESYNLILTIEFLGAVNQAIVKPEGRQMEGETEFHRVRFDFDGEITSWLSEGGLTAQTNLPQTNGDCAQRLSSRVNL